MNDVEGGGGSTDSERGGGPDLDHARDDEAAGDLKPEGRDLDPDHPDHPARQDERLDEGLEETFPASDPVAAKHIT